MLLSGRVVTPTAVLDDGAVVVNGDRIVWVGRRPDAPGAAIEPEGWRRGRTLLPGLVDIHCHGGAGAEFGADLLAGQTAVNHHLHAGTTRVVGSLVSGPAEVLLAGVRAGAELVRSGVLAGVHVEGPFLSEARRGAQDPTALIDPDPALVEALCAEAGGTLLQMTFAPERAGSRALIEQLASYDVIPAVGHTDADAGVAREALQKVSALAPRGGKALVTHVFNGMPPLHHRSPGPAAAALGQAALAEAVLEVVGDGVHLADETVRMLFETVGPRSLALVTDAMAASGMPDGRYSLGGREVDVADRTARLADGGAIAGGVATLLDVVRRCVTRAGLPLRDVVTAASHTPAAVMGWNHVGALEPGRQADVVVCDDELQRVCVLRSGSWAAGPDVDA
jgi:N-acetylglucosamine-6-phosphate deacetylase